MKISTEERQRKAAALRKQGYNCAQCVLMAFNDVTGLDDSLAARLASALGSGVGAHGEICGVANAMAIIEGTLHGPEASEKVPASKGARAVCQRFIDENEGRIRCRDLKSQPGVRPCDELIAQGIAIFNEHLEEIGT